MVTVWYFQAVLLGWLQSLFSRFLYYILWKNPNEPSGQLNRLRGYPGAGRGEMSSRAHLADGSRQVCKVCFTRTPTSEEGLYSFILLSLF